MNLRCPSHDCAERIPMNILSLYLESHNDLDISITTNHDSSCVVSLVAVAWLSYLAHARQPPTARSHKRRATSRYLLSTPHN